MITSYRNNSKHTRPISGEQHKAVDYPGAFTVDPQAGVTSPINSPTCACQPSYNLSHAAIQYVAD